MSGQVTGTIEQFLDIKNDNHLSNNTSSQFKKEESVTNKINKTNLSDPYYFDNKKNIVGENNKFKKAEPKKPTAYNNFMQSELLVVKTANPQITHKEAFKISAGNWKNSSLNPLNIK